MGLPRLGFAKRLLFIYGFIFVTALLATDWSLSRVLEKRDLDQLQKSLTRQSSLIREFAVPLLQNTRQLQAQIEKLSKETSTRISIIDPNGIVLADSGEPFEKIAMMDNHATRPEVAAALRKTPGASTRYSMTLNTPMLYVAIPILEGEKLKGVVRTAMPVIRVDEILATARKPILFSLLIGILLIFGIGFLFAHQLTQRIRKITSIAERFSREDWSEKILIGGKDELKLLADTMNRMASTLQSRIEDLETEKGKISAILSNMTEAVIAIDHRKQLVTANPNAENIFGFKSNTTLGKSLIEITRHPQLERSVDHALKEQKTLTDEIRLSFKDQKILRVNIVIPGIQLRDIGSILVFHDVTEIRRLENIRKEFVANASHELRTPLTSVKGFIETLLGGALKDPAATERFLKIMQEDAARLGRLVDDMLILGEIEQGIAPIKKEAFDVIKEIREVVVRLNLQAQSKKIEIEDRLPEGPLEITGDRDKVRQVFINLIDNAIKFNKEGGKIILKAKQGEKEVQISIEDTGIGIPQEALGRIFERFFRVDKGRSRELGGTGLGLAIVKHIMEAHGGQASCKSIPGQGSTFTVLFPT